MDLFTCGSKPLLPVVSTIERLFGIGDEIRTQWSHELRGFRPEDENKHNYLADSSDLALWVLSPLEMHTKEQIFSGMTKYQRVDIWDIVEVTDTPTYKDVIKYNMTVGDPRLNSPDYVTPDRLLFLDGTIQSITSAENIYHEGMYLLIVKGASSGPLRRASERNLPIFMPAGTQSRHRQTHASPSATSFS